MACKCELRKKIKAAAATWTPERTVYLDYNATTPVDPRVIGAFERACRHNWGNPSSLHSAGTAGWDELQNLYNTAGNFFSVATDGFSLCSNGTEAINTAILGFAARNHNANFITTNIEHQAVKHPLFHLAKKSPAAPSSYNGNVITLKVDEDGKLNLHELEKAIKQGRGISVITYSPVNHETGSIQPIKEISEIAKRNGAIIIMDAVQAAPRMCPSKWSQYCDVFCMSGHKIYAPKGSALLWKKSNIKLAPLSLGGNQNGSLFPGTENIPGAAALSEAIKLMQKEQADELKILSALKKDAINILKQSSIPFKVESPQDSVPGILCISLNSHPNMEKLLFKLNESNICLSRFSACSEKINGQSNILRQMGRSTLTSQSSLRISFGRWSKREDFYKLAKALKLLSNY
ncbi:MAG: aminotransferase class V-fold PLP-dependent enzyme [Spirochaetales bacterium]|nr:aminotransferase class V-fold PLP-dependent enzyme [Spirochaetales bacterium]